MKLLFLPPELVRYVFVHELCHTVHMNHSREFWRFLAVKEPGYMELDKQLRTAWRLVPAWLGDGTTAPYPSSSGITHAQLFKGKTLFSSPELVAEANKAATARQSNSSCAPNPRSL